MELIPAIDIKNGQAVRLRQGKMNDVDVFSDDPSAVADRWVEAGAKRLHLVDLDGAKSGQPVNMAIITQIAANHPGVAVQVGGGVRNEDTVQAYLDAGLQYVVLGTRAVNEPHLLGDLCLEFPRHIIVGLDAKDGKVAVDGWSKLSQHDLIDLAQHFERDGVEAIVYTDISRDGMMKGPNVEATRELAQSVAVPVIASGGVSKPEDLTQLATLEEDGVSGIIVGRALYEGTIDLKSALQQFG